MLIISRLTYSGYIFYYLNHFYEFPNLSSIFNLFTISYVGMNLAMLFYFHEFLKFYSKPQWYYLTLYVLIIIRFSLLIYQVAMPFDTHFIISHAIDLVIQFFFLVVIFKTPKKYRSLNILAASSLILLILGNLMLQPVFPLLFEGLSNYVFFLNLAGIEVFVFAINMAYRTYFLKKERELAMAKVVENLQERELLKDRLNKELEIKVEERTQQIQKMNELLKSHNIELKSEVAHANEARVFQKIMDFSDFQRIFPDDEACYQYLAKLKWKPNEITYCKKCGSKASPNYEKLSIRCGKCKYLESVTNNTLFQKLKFPILKAFYITYRLSTATNDSITMASLAEEIELRPATLWTFKQKVIALKDANKSRKKHKDGWTHLIEYSIIKDIIGDK